MPRESRSSPTPAPPPAPLRLLPDAPVRPPSLPRALTSFVGRASEIAAVAALLTQSAVRLVTITGPGGVGKTRLAIRVAEETLAAFPDGTWFVPLAAVRDPQLLAETVARVLEVRGAGDRSHVDGIRAFLSERAALLVFDNFEHLVGAATLLVDVLATCPNVTMLVTSRAVLRVSYEHVAVRHDSLFFPAGQSAQVIVGCGTGEIATGGGTPHDDLTIDGSYPYQRSKLAPTPTGWVVYGSNPNAFGRFIEPYVICAPAS